METSFGKLIIVTGPGSVGKDTVVNKLLKIYPKMKKVITTTSRPPRSWEVPNKDYYFLAEEQFKKFIETDNLLEYVRFGGYLYGTTKEAIKPFLEGQDMVWKVEITRGGQIRELFEQNYPDKASKLFQNTLVVYLDVPDWDILRERLKARGANEHVVKQRLEADKKDWTIFKDKFQNIVINMPGELDKTVKEVSSLIEQKFKRARFAKRAGT